MVDGKRNRLPSRDELFLHDVTGHFHGLLLFLNRCIQGKKRPSLRDCRHLAHEIEILQLLTEGHFDGFCEKTFFSPDQKFVKESVTWMIKNFLPEHEKFCSLYFYGKWKIFNYAVFFRIMGNLVKNMAESGTEKAEFVFKANSEGFFFVIKNKFEGKGRRSKGLGLFSIEELCRNAGGRFCFFVKDGCWINEGWLPWEEKSKAA